MATGRRPHRPPRRAVRSHPRRPRRRRDPRRAAPHRQRASRSPTRTATRTSSGCVLDLDDRSVTGRGSTTCSRRPTCSSRTSTAEDRRCPRPRARRGPQRATPTSCTSSLTDLGLSGPAPTWHLEPLPALAASGALWASGFPDLPPCNAPGHLAHDCASVYGAIGAVAAVLDRERRDDDAGQLVEVSAQEAALAGTIPWSIAMQDYLDDQPAAAGRRARATPTARTGCCRRRTAGCAWSSARRSSGTGSRRSCAIPSSSKPTSGSNPGFRLANADVIRMRRRGPPHRPHPGRSCSRRRSHSAPRSGCCTSRASSSAHPQTTAHRYFVGRPRYPASRGCRSRPNRSRFARTPSSIRRPAASTTTPAFGARRHPAGSPLGRGPRAAARRRPGDRVRRRRRGPRAVRRALGARRRRDQDRVDRPSRRAAHGERQPRADRQELHLQRRSAGVGAASPSTSRPSGAASSPLALCATADVVAENQRGGALDARGLGYDAIRARNPRVIYVSSQGYGRGGPFGEMPAYGPLNSGFSGVHLLWNHPDAPYPCGTSMNHPDHIAGRLLAVGVLAALARAGGERRGPVARARADRGRRLPRRRGLPRGRPRQASTRAPRQRPSGGVRRTASTRRPATTSGSRSRSWTTTRGNALCAAVGWARRSDLATTAARVAARTEIDERLAAWTSERTKEDAAELLQAHGVSAMPVMGPRRPSRRSAPARNAAPSCNSCTPRSATNATSATRCGCHGCRSGRARVLPASAPTPKRCSRPCSASTADEVAELVADGVCR